MKTFIARLLISALSLMSLNLCAGCAGGSYGTGVRNFNGQFPINSKDRSTQRSIEWPWGYSCSVNQHSFEIETELGRVKPVSDNAHSKCIARIPNQGSETTITVSGYKNLRTEMRYRLERISCQFKNHELVSDGQLAVVDGRVRLPQLSWSRDSYFEFTLWPISRSDEFVVFDLSSLGEQSCQPNN